MSAISPPTPSLVYTSQSPTHSTTTNREIKEIVKPIKTLSRYTQLSVSTANNTTPAKVASAVNLPSLKSGDQSQSRTRRGALVDTQEDSKVQAAVATDAQICVDMGDLGAVTEEMFIGSFSSRSRSVSTESRPIADTQEALDTYMAHGIPYINRVPNT